MTAPAPSQREPVRILRVIARMNVGGPAYHVALLSGRLDGGRVHTRLVTGSLGQGEGSLEHLAGRYGTPLRVIPPLRPEISPWNDLKALFQLAREVRRFAPDIVHTHTAKAGTLGRIAAVLALRPRPIIVHTYHGHVLTGYFGPAKNAVFRAIERILARWTDVLIGVSNSTVAELVELGVASRGKFRAIPIGLDLDRFLEADASDGAAFRSQLGANPGDVVVTFVGRLVPIKRVDLLLDAAAALQRRDQPVRVAIVGDGEERAALESQAAALGLGERVRFLGFRDDLAAIMAGSDIAVLCSANEGTPVSLIEAGAAGRPAVATDVGGVADIVTPDTGVLVAPGDAEALGSAIEQLVRDPGRRRVMGAAAREHVRDTYSASRLVTDIESLYGELLTARGRS